MSRKFYLILALAITIMVSSGVYAASYTSGLRTVNIADPTGDMATVNATGAQPDWSSVLTPVNEDIILRPVGAGDETEVNDQFPASGEHWDKVDEAASDNDTTYISTSSNIWQEDLYHTANHSTQTAGGDIQYVEVFMVSRVTLSAEQVSAYVHIKTNSAEYNGASENLTPSYATYLNQWNDNPQTGSPWTWDEIDDLQIGVGLSRAGSSIDSLCTQVYTNINFDAPELTGNTPTGDLKEVTAHSSYSGNLQVRVYLTNTDALQKAYDYIDMHLYLESSQEAAETPNYQLMNLQNGVATFNLVDVSGGSYTLSVTGGDYQLLSRETSEWEAGWTVTPEFYCEVTQR